MQIGKYTVEKELGHGGFGRVYLAFDPEMERRVAIKVLLDPDKRKYFEFEAFTTGKLQHRNIVTVYDRGTDKSSPFLVMEFLEGVTLKAVVEQTHTLSVLDKVQIMAQVADGLAYAHARSVVHRDIKPENIMLLPDHTAKIMDFGIALAPERTDITLTGCTVGSPNYMAPELFLDPDLKANERTDIFSFGDVFYELLAGSHPFVRMAHQYKVNVITAITNYEPVPLGDLVGGLPEALERLVHRCLSKDPLFRYRNFSEVLISTQEVLADLQHDRADALVSQAQISFARGELQGAREQILEAQHLEPGNRDARHLRERIDQQVRHAEVSQRVVHLMAEARRLLAERRFPEAVQALEAAARLDPSDTTVRDHLADARQQLDCFQQACRLVEEGRSKADEGRADKAIPLLKSALEIDPRHTAAARLLDQVNSRLQQDELLRSHERSERFKVGVWRTREVIEEGDLDRAREMIHHLETNFATEPTSGESIRDLHARWDVAKNTREVSALRSQVQDLLDRDVCDQAAVLLREAMARYPQERCFRDLSVALEAKTVHRQAQTRELRSSVAVGGFSGEPAAPSLTAERDRKGPDLPPPAPPEKSPAGRFGWSPARVTILAIALLAVSVLIVYAMRDQVWPAPELSLQAAAPDTATIGVPYSGVLQATGGRPPRRWSVTKGELPSGVSLGPADGRISGTPTAAGIFEFSARISDTGGQNAEREYRIIVHDAPETKPPNAAADDNKPADPGTKLHGAALAPLAFTAAIPPPGKVRDPYEFRLAGTGGAPPHRFALRSGKLPPGLKVGPEGSIYGTPAAEGTFDCLVRLTDSKRQQIEKRFQIVIRPAASSPVTPDSGTSRPPVEVPPRCPSGVPVDAEEYSGFNRGTIDWRPQGSSGKPVLIVGDSIRSGGGVITQASRGFPGTPVRISASGVDILELPNRQNGFNCLIFQPQGNSVRITWEVEPVRK